MHKNKQWKNGKQQFWAEYGLISILGLAEGCRNLAVTAVNWGLSSGTKPELSPQPHTRIPGVDHGWWWAPCSPPLNPTKPAAPIHLIKDVKNNAAENTVMTISNLAFHLLGPTTALIPQVWFVCCCCCCLAMQHVGPSPTRDGTHVPCIGRRTLNHWSSREALHWGFLVDFNCRLFLKLHLIKPYDLQTNISDWHGSFSEMQNCRSPMRPTELESTS